MAENIIKAQKRTNLKTSKTKQLREEGKIPGNFYPKGGDSQPIVVEKTNLFKSLDNNELLYEIDLEGDTTKCLIREIQWDPVSDEPLHVDIMGITMDDTVKVNVPIITTGESIGVAEGGVLNQTKWDLTIKCKAGDIPGKIETDVTDLDVGESIAVSELEVGDVEILDDPNISVVSVVEPTEVVTTEDVLEAAEELGEVGVVEGEEEELEEGEEAEEGEEGEEAEEAEEGEEAEESEEEEEK